MGLRLELAGISMAYNGLPVLEDCTFSFKAGGSAALMGPNGAGKSTLLRIAALLERPDRGEIRYFAGDKLLGHDLPVRRLITLLLPKIGVFNTTVYANVAFGLKIRGVKRAEMGVRVREVLETVGLTHKISQRALELSSGETKRLGLARALVLRPEVLFLDEPTIFLDRASIDIIENCLLELKKQRAMTIILVTHDPAQAERLGDQRLFLEHGKIVPGKT
jgi:tungstate transport system ATP-binding protein